jgi:hypothetical protein
MVMNNLPLPALFDEIERRSAVNAGFRRQLLSDPNAAIREAFGVILAEGMRLRFIERPQDVDFLLVLPDYVGDSRRVD